ncbi:hypothetical protein HYE69_02500 [Staphylococcus sp. GSSP0090]|nr:hypothetical protein [Staphylococcus sp. GSSP0090]
MDEFNFDTEEFLEEQFNNYVNIEEEEIANEYPVKYSTASTSSCMGGCAACAATLACF